MIETRCLSINMKGVYMKPVDITRSYLVPADCQQEYPFICENRESNEPVGKQIDIADSDTTVNISCP